VRKHYSKLVKVVALSTITGRAEKSKVTPDLLENTLEDPPIVGCSAHQKICEGDHCGVIGFIGYGADAKKGDVIDFTSVGNGGGFHIGTETMVSVPEFTRFFEFANELVTA